MRGGRLLLVVGVLGVVALGCNGDDESDGTGPDEVPVLEVGGDAATSCLQVDDDLPAEVEELPVVECAGPHTHEIYATVIYEERDVYPGVEELSSYAQVECLERFETFVGISTFDSTLTYTWLVPSLAGWTDEEDREILCALASADGAPLTGSMADAAR